MLSLKWCYLLPLCLNCEEPTKRRKYCSKCHRYLCQNCFGSRDYCNSCYGREFYIKGHNYEQALYKFYTKRLRKFNKRIIESDINQGFQYSSGSFEIDIYFRIWGGIWILIEAKDLARPMNFVEVDQTIKTRFRLFRYHFDANIIGIIESKKGYTKNAYKAAKYERYPIILAQNFIRRRRHGEPINFFNTDAKRNQFIMRFFELHEYE